MLRRKEVCKGLKAEVKVIISGGGTGGHIFPAIAIANGLRSIDPQIKLLFVGANGRMEMEKVPAAGFDIVGLDISGIKRSLSLSNLAFPFKLMASLLKAARIVKRFKPQVAVGVGGYASGPLLWAASRLGISTVIQEQNSYPGITNKLLAGKAQLICTGYDNMEKYFPSNKTVFTGNPVRKEMVDIAGKREEAFRFFGLENNKPVVLVIGGSQGARSINHAIMKGFAKFKESNIQVLWQCGKQFHPEALQATSTTNGIHAFDFIARMDLAYAAADLVVSRAGASTVSELCVVGKPAIMVPLPTAAEDHQTHNCLSMVSKKAAILVKDSDAAMQLVDKAIEVVTNRDLMHELATNMSKGAVTDAADKIARKVYDMALEKLNSK
ncbi:MAG: undecaprenyldiphospho-muramoylpentapeptide beta-N-acetylglucosaminyltransferase [Bacteroidota bacterium]|jgi:UDP-N-acetylglucosamine--N-acetylmuramyl-(pentapeptide) pyrophosphoryl-undecaprenol N-acetylglucosamine transferase